MKNGAVEVQLLHQQLTFIIRVWVDAGRCNASGLPIRSFVDTNPKDFPSEGELYHRVGIAAAAIAEQHEENYKHSPHQLNGEKNGRMLDPADAYKMARDAFRQELIAYDKQRRVRMN